MRKGSEVRTYTYCKGVVRKDSPGVSVTTLMEAIRDPVRHLERVPLVRLDHADPPLFAELMRTVERVAATGGFTGGDEVTEFEAEFATYSDAEHAVGVSSGTEALALTLKAMGVGPADEVILPTNSFIATAEAVTLAGAMPRFADVDPEYHTITAETIEPHLGPRTRAVIAVHLYGRPADLDPIVALAGSSDLRVIEDACQAHGAVYRGRRVGSIGDAGCFSFYPTKNLGAWGDGGAVVTDDEDLAERIRLLRSHGENPRNHHRMPGTTARLDALQAAILRVKLRHLEEWNARRRETAALLTAALEGASVELPAPAHPEGDHVFHQYVVHTDRRDELRGHLEVHGIASGIHYPTPIHLAPAYAGIATGPLPVAERHAERCCSLPMSPYQSREETARIADAVTAFAGAP